MDSDDDGPVYEARYRFRRGPIAGVLATLVAIGMLIAIDYIARSERHSLSSTALSDPTIAAIAWWAMLVLVVFGVYGTLRSAALAIVRRVAVRIDQHGVTTTGKAITHNGAARRSRTVPWGRFDTIATEFRKKSPNGAGDVHLLLLRTEHGSEVNVGRDHHIYGHDLDLDEVRRVAEFYAPGLHVVSR